MKLRVRFKKRTLVAHLTESDTCRPTLASLKEFISTQFELQDFAVSLNGRDVLSCEEDGAELASLDIVSGDLIHVLSEEPGPPPAAVQPDRPAASPSLKPEASAVHQESPSTSQGVTATAGATSSTSSGQNAAAEEASQAEAMQMDIDDKDCIQDAEVNRYLHEPVLLQDCSAGTVPQSLLRTFQANPPVSANDALCLALNILMLEAGYTLQQGDSADVVHSFTLPSGWKKTGHYQLVYTHPMTGDKVIKMSMVSLGPLLVVHGVVVGGETAVKIQLKTADYVKSTQDASSAYKDLPRLSRTFKDGFTQPLLVTLRNEMGMPLETSLSGLYRELKIAILRCLDAVSLARMAAVCAEFRELGRDPYLWRRLYLKDFGRRSVSNDIDQDWFQLYREKSVLRKRMREEMRRMTFVTPPFIDRPDPPFPFTPVYPPGFIGGDYDRDPTFPGLPGIGGPMPGPLMPRPRFDPIGPLPDQRFRPGRGGGLWDGGGGNRMGRNNRGSFGLGPRFF